MSLGLRASFIAFAWVLGLACTRPSSAAAAGAEPPVYVCPPCGQACDAKTFDGPGVCPSCGMALVERTAVAGGTDSAVTVKHTAFEGDWAGTFQIGSTPTAIGLHVHPVDGVLRPIADLVPFENGLPVDSPALTDSTLTGRIEHERGAIDLRLVADGPIATGRAATSAGSSPIRLLRLAPVASATLRSFEGIYRAGERSFLVEFLNGTWGLTCVELPSGSARALFPTSESTFVSGPTLMLAEPEVRRLTFESGGRLRIRQGDSTFTARRVPLPTRAVKFPSGDAMLAGTLILPEAGGQHPAIVFMHGSGAAPRTSFFGMGYWLAANGFVVLKYDKRGSGESTGSLAGFTYEQLGDDGAAAARWLASQPEVDSTRIGFWGISEGAWTCVLAATRFPHTAFTIPVSGGGLSPAEGELLDTDDQLRGDGRFSTAQIRAALTFQSARDRYARTGKDWDAYARARAEAVKQPWWSYPATDLFGPGRSDSPFWREKATTYFYEPAATLRRLHCPLLSIFGQYDTPRGIHRSQAAMRSALAAAKDHDVTFVVLPHANHNLLDAGSGSEKDLPLSDHYTPELYSITRTWLIARMHPEED